MEEHIDWCSSYGRYMDADCTCPCPCDSGEESLCSKEYPGHWEPTLWDEDDFDESLPLD